MHQFAQTNPTTKSQVSLKERSLLVHVRAPTHSTDTSQPGAYDIINLLIYN